MKAIEVMHLSLIFKGSYRNYEFIKLEIGNHILSSSLIEAVEVIEMCGLFAKNQLMKHDSLHVGDFTIARAEEDGAPVLSVSCHDGFTMFYTPFETKIIYAVMSRVLPRFDILAAGYTYWEEPYA